MAKKDKKPAAIAIAAHPDDIEYGMAGTLLMLARSGYDIHYLNVSSGNCGSVDVDGETTAKVRRRESRNAAKVLGATWHPPITDDLEVFYELKTLRKLASVVRKVRPSIVLTHSPEDYMEDHMIAGRLAVTAAFALGMPNFKVTPSRKPVDLDVSVYHAMPHGLRDPLRRRIVPGACVNTEPVYETKLAALAAHESQQNWLDVSQGMNSYLQTMTDFSLEVGRMSGAFAHAEGWRRHLHYGFSGQDRDLLHEVLRDDCLINEAYERNLEEGS